MASQYGLARLVSVDVDSDFWVAEYQNGNFDFLQVSALDDPKSGKLVLVGIADGRIYPAPPSMRWGVPMKTAGVVRHHAGDRVVLEIGGAYRLSPTDGSPAIDVGDLVTISERGEVDEVITTEKVLRAENRTSVHEVDRDQLSEDDDDEFVGQDVLAEVQRAVELPLKEPDKFKRLGVKPTKGVLFIGPPGTGKTMMARRLARTADAAFFVINGPELSSRFVGDAEKDLRELFDNAGSRERSLIYFDEIDAVAPTRTQRTHETGIEFVAMLLSLMDGVHARSNVQVIGSTNRAHSIDPALRRGGRFQTDIYFPLPGATERRRILENRARGMGIAFDLQEIALHTDGWSAADVSSLWDEAGWCAIEDGRDEVLGEDMRIALERRAKQHARRQVTEVSR